MSECPSCEEKVPYGHTCRKTWQEERIEALEAENKLKDRQISALKRVIKSVRNLKEKPQVTEPIYNIQPTFQQMVTIAGCEEIENEEVLTEIERKLEIHNEWKWQEA